jgi:ABC-type sugar transport system substrate-binding protein
MPQALRVGLCVGPDDPYWVLVREAIYQRAEQFAIHLIPVDGVDTAGLAETQASLAEELLAQELDALITNSIAEGLARRILEYGLPIICASESGSRHPRFVSPVTLYGAAQMAGRYLVERLSDRGNVLSAGMNTVGVHRWFVVIL